MYDRAWHTALSQELARDDEKKELRGLYALIFQVELILYVLERFHMEQALHAPWFLLSGLNLPLFTTRFTEEEHHLLARAKVYSPYSGRFRWETDFWQYQKMAEEWRAYRVKNGKIIRTGRHLERLDVYEQTLTTPIPQRLHHQQMARSGERVMFEDSRRSGLGKPVILEVSSDAARARAVKVPWFSSQLPEREDAIVVQQSTLLDIAREMKSREDCYLQARGEAGTGTDWEKLARNIRFRKRGGDGHLGEVNEEPIVLQGCCHLAGTISAGKTTLMKMVAFQAAKERRRVTLIVSDVMTALELTEFFNGLFCNEGDPPVAVPLLGRTTLEKNLSRLCNATSYKKHHRHRALRYLHYACLLFDEWPSSVPESLPLGHEPCQRLALVSRREEEELDFAEAINHSLRSKSFRSCPYFSLCPMQQAYHDLLQAPIWITTPGALGSMSIPSQLDSRQIKLWELIYEQSALVCFDEADVVQNWFDRVCAPESILVSSSGILDRLDPQLSVAWATHRVLEPQDSRGVYAVRHATAVTSPILTQLDHHGVLARWVYHTYFTGYTLFFQLAHLFAGIQEPEVAFEFDLDEDNDDEMQPLFPQKSGIPLPNKKLNTIMHWFYRVMETDPQKISSFPVSDPVQQLLQIREHILVKGSCPEEAKMWITRWIPTIHSHLQKRQPPPKPGQKRHHLLNETLDTLALKLDFALMVSVLDAEMQIIYDEWYNGILHLDSEYRFEHAPRHLLGLLPVPPTGRLFGFYYHRGEVQKERDPREEEPPKSPCLAVFAYSLVGRTFLSQFHALRAAIDERPGPHVLALSGTSWLPHSSFWHIDVPPAGVLEPEDSAKRAIAQSTFTFLPQYEDDSRQEKPIFVSGTKMMLQNLQKIARSLISEKHPYLRQELERIRQREKEELEERERKIGTAQSPQWENRARLLLLVNSYDQVQVVAQEIARSPEWRGQVYGLKRGNDVTQDYWVEVSQWYKPWNRSDFERFGETEAGTILVAPMQAIGRGYNALNEQNIAAFGAIYFLTRPMPHPFDTQAQASEMNKTVLDWCHNPNHRLWRYKNISHMAVALRSEAYRLWYEMDHRFGYRALSVEKKKDLAATTAGLVMQACGRLVRGGVPFDAYFVDAAWAPRSARKGKDKDTPQTSLLAALIAVLLDYAKDPLGEALLGPYVQALKKINNFPHLLSWRRR
ncbi:MAG TPA: hypothetical protein VFV38_21625 [Ktedonobacteraceae bacterium]|nr:hypothetical protein [Ktedonobacteraceae bacterium]